MMKKKKIAETSLYGNKSMHINFVYLTEVFIFVSNFDIILNNHFETICCIRQIWNRKLNI